MSGGRSIYIPGLRFAGAGRTNGERGPLKMEPIEGSETSTYNNQTPGKHPKEYIIDVTSMLHCKCGLKSTVKWLFNIRISVDGGDLDNSVCRFITFGFSFGGVPVRKQCFMLWLSCAEPECCSQPLVTVGTPLFHVLSLHKLSK